ncbi:unnamed protein product [Larinioides sclopetarius]|uniref:Uncharacterized protein n=1 Tax=Larinioides sclopetarius TaxID=280406 RepID=A0AAV2B8W5_9ARAC
MKSRFVLLSSQVPENKVSDGQQKRVPCWTRRKCDTCTRKSRIGQMSLCCEECSVGKLNVRVTKSKVYCWCLVPNK